MKLTQGDQAANLMKTGLDSPVLCAYILCIKGLNSALLHTLEKPVISMGRA